MSQLCTSVQYILQLSSELFENILLAEMTVSCEMVHKILNIRGTFLTSRVFSDQRKRRLGKVGLSFGWQNVYNEQINKKEIIGPNLYK